MNQKLIERAEAAAQAADLLHQSLMDLNRGAPGLVYLLVQPELSEAAAQKTRLERIAMALREASAAGL